MCERVTELWQCPNLTCTSKDIQLKITTEMLGDMGYTFHKQTKQRNHVHRSDLTHYTIESDKTVNLGKLKNANLNCHKLLCNYVKSIIEHSLYSSAFEVSINL